MVVIIAKSKYIILLFNIKSLLLLFVININSKRSFYKPIYQLT